MAAEGGAERGKGPLERICLDLLREARLGRAVPYVKGFDRNTMIEIKRAGAFLRLYVSDEVRCSVRMNTKAHKARRDNFALYSPREGTPESEMRRVLVDEVGLLRTMEAVARVSYDPEGDPSWISEHLTPWLERWCDPCAEELPAKQERRRISVTLGEDDYQRLREHAFCRRVSPNKAASDLISKAVREWEPEGADSEMLDRLRPAGGS